MVIGWICSRDLFETSWEGLHEVLAIVIAEESSQCLRVCFHCLSGVVIVTLNRSCHIRTYTPDAGDHGELFWSGFGWDDSHYYAHTKATYVYWHNASLIDSITLVHTGTIALSGTVISSCSWNLQLQYHMMNWFANESSKYKHFWM